MCGRRWRWSVAVIYLIAPVLPMKETWARRLVFAAVWLVVPPLSCLVGFRDGAAGVGLGDAACLDLALLLHRADGAWRRP